MFKNLPGLGVAGLESGPSTWVDGARKGTHAESVISGSEKLNPSVGGRSQSQEKILGSQGVLKGSESRKRGQHREAR